MFSPQHLEPKPLDEVEDVMFSSTTDLPEIQDTVFGNPKAKNAVIYVHGYTGSNLENMYQANYLALHGYSVFMPLLPGHGTNYKDLDTTTWQDWVQKVEQTFDYVIDRYNPKRIFLAGHSLGGAIALRLAINHSDKTSGLIMMASPFDFPWYRKMIAKIGKRLGLHLPYDQFHFHDERLYDHPLKETYLETYHKVSFYSVDQILQLVELNRQELSKVQCPTKFIYAKHDYLIPESSITIIKENFQDPDISFVEYSDHVLVIDTDKEKVANHILEFLKKHSV